MSKCLPCSKVSTTEHDIVKFYKKLFKEKGKEYFVYRLASKETFNFVEKRIFFKEILEQQVEPNFKHGAEYFSIQEFTGN